MTNETRFHLDDRPLPARYYKTDRFPKWGINPTPLQEYRLMRRWGWNKEEHIKASRFMLALSIHAADTYGAESRLALDTYGDAGALISGVLRDHFPDYVKDRLRRLCREQSEYASASLAHWQAAGRRIDTWRENRYKAIQIKGR